MSLSTLPKGKRAVVIRIDGGLGLRNNLLQLGIVPGVPIRKIQGEGDGPMILEVLGTQVLLGEGMAQAVSVK